MTDDATIIAGAAMVAAPDGDSAAIYGGSNPGNYRLPMFYFDERGRIGIYAFGGGATRGAVGGPDNRGQGPVVASMHKIGMVANVRRNGVEVASATFEGTYGTATTAALGILHGGSLISSMEGSLYPIIIIKGTLPESEVLVLEEFVGGLSGVAV